MIGLDEAASAYAALSETRIKVKEQKGYGHLWQVDGSHGEGEGGRKDRRKLGRRRMRRQGKFIPV